MNQSQFIKLLFLSLGIIMGVTIANLKMCSKSYAPNPGKIVPTTIVKSEIAAHEKKYQEDLKLLNRKDTALNNKKSPLKSAIAQKKKDRERLTEDIAESLATTDYTDSSAVLCTPNQLKIDVTDLIARDADIDSFYLQLTSTLEQQVDTKDSIISVKDEQYLFAKTKMDESLLHQQLLYEQNRLTQKELLRHKKKNKILSAAILLLGGAVTYTLLHH